MTFVKGDFRKGNRGGKKGRSGRPKGPVSEREREQRRRAGAAKKSRLTNESKVLAKTIKQAMQEGVLQYLHGVGLKRMLMIIEAGEDRDALRAWGELADRYGLPRRTEQSVRMDGALPVIEFRRVGFEAPGGGGVQ